jgi:uncharacterized OB-fold protein
LFCQLDYDIYLGYIPSYVKYLYCPRCKELRAKSWYQIRNKCQLCFADATAIQIPNTWMTYALYVLYVVTPGLVLVYVSNDEKPYLYAAVVLLVLMIVLSWLEVSRGLAYARTKIKVTSADVKDFKKRGWN